MSLRKAEITQINRLSEIKDRIDRSTNLTGAECTNAIARINRIITKREYYLANAVIRVWYDSKQSPVQTATWLKTSLPKPTYGRPAKAPR